MEVSRSSTPQLRQQREGCAPVLSADRSSTCPNTAVALTPHLLSSAFLSHQLKVLLHFLQVVKLRIDVRGLLRDSQLSADLFLLALSLFIDLRCENYLPWLHSGVLGP